MVSVCEWPSFGLSTVWALTGPLKDTGQLKSELSLRVSPSRMSRHLAALICPSTVTSLPVAEEHSIIWCCHHHVSPLEWYEPGTVQYLFSSDIWLLVLPKEFKTSESFSPVSPESFHMPFIQEWLSSCHSPMKVWFMARCRDGRPANRFFHHCTVIFWNSLLELFHSVCWNFSYLPDQSPSFPDAQLGCVGNYRNVQGCAQLLPFQHYYGHCGPGKTQSLKNVFYTLVRR